MEIDRLGRYRWKQTIKQNKLKSNKIRWHNTLLKLCCFTLLNKKIELEPIIE